MNCGEAIVTRLQRGCPSDYKLKRTRMIDEAISWSPGDIRNPNRYVVGNLPNGGEVFFLKPGKEVSRRASTNPNDMTPLVASEDYRLNFEEIWNLLARASLVDYEAFRMLLVLIYRSTFLLDHVEQGNGIRYRPAPQIATCIDDLEQRIGRVFPFGVWGMLHFIDVLGWNEDVKYHSVDGRGTFTEGKNKKKPAVGRCNTLLTCIRVPYQVSAFARQLVEQEGRRDEADFSPLFSAMQAFVRRRGTCPPTQTQLVEWFDPYIQKRKGR